jgi:hypothetical protein
VDKISRIQGVVYFFMTPCAWTASQNGTYQDRWEHQLFGFHVTPFHDFLQIEKDDKNALVQKESTQRP